MSVLVNSDFSAGLDSWAVVSGSGTITQNSAVGPDDAAGIALIQGHAGGNTTIERTFTCATTGYTKFSFWHKDNSTSTNAGSAATTNIYLMLQGGAVSSANATAYLALSRDTGAGATSRLIRLIYRDNASFVNDILLPRGSWYKITVVVDHTNKKYDIYFNDLLWVKAATCPNAGSFSSSGKVAIIQSATVLSTALSFDSPYVEDSYTESLGESTLIDDDFTAASGEIEDHVADTDTRNFNKQPWKIADRTSAYGGYTFDSTNGAKPDAAKSCVGMLRCRPDGIIEVEFKSSATTADIYMALWGRVWAGIGSDSYLSFTYQGSDNSWRITQGSTTLVGSFSPVLSANTVYTLKFEMRGRVLTGSYKAAAMGSGSYTQVLQHTIISSATGSRGQLSEENCGIFHLSSIASQDNYARRFKFTGKIPADETDFTIGGNSYNLCYGSIRGLYNSTVDSPTRNLFWSKGPQYGHRSQADMGNGLCKQDTIYNGTHVKAYRQRALMLSETECYGDADCYVTFLRRGPWIADGVRVYANTTGINYTPDCDFRGGLWSTSYYSASESGTANSRTNSAPQDWNSLESSTNPLKGIQSLTTGTNTLRLSQVQRNNQNLSGVTNYVTTKYEGNGDPISRAFNVDGSSLTDNTFIEAGRAFLLQTGALSLDATTLEQWRDDIGAPATLSMTTGTLTTNASGDLDADGFNERHGWYEVACAGGLLNFTVPIASGKRFGLAFRISGCTTNTVVKIAGVTAVANTDYTLDDLGGGVWVLQLLSDRTADTSVEIAAAPSSGGVRGMGSRYGHTLLRP